MWACSRRASTAVRQAAAVAAFVCAAETARSPVSAFEILPASVALLERWDDAVRTHEPGKLDESVDRILAITLHDRYLLDPAIRLFLAALAGSEPETSSALERHVARLGTEARQKPGAIAYLQRAVMLHTDAAIAGEGNQRTIADLPRQAPGIATSPLLATRRMIVSRDGAIIGQMESDWNWPFARSLIDLMRTAAPADRFAAEWFHMTSAYMFARGLYAEAFAHLTHATRLLPDDALVLFDRASYAENQGLPMNQVLLRGADPIALRKLRQGTARLPASATDATRRAAGLDIPPKGEANADAERLFRRALKADPALHEARARLGRLLVERQAYNEAVRELRTVLQGSESPAVRFYAHLFAGRAEQGVGHLDAAALDFAKAAELFPTAQSALLAQSQLALIRADAAGAIGPIEKLPREPQPDIRDGDPWWAYRLAAGREWQELYQTLRTKVRAP